MITSPEAIKIAAVIGAIALIAPPSWACQEAVPSALDESGSLVTREEFDGALDGFEELQQQIDELRTGTRGFLVSGYFTTGYEDNSEDNSTFEAAFSPVFLWNLDESFLVEAELEMGTGGHGIELEYAQASWVASDYATVGAGLFLSPFGTFNERFHPTWINRLPTAPLYAGHHGLVPTSVLGAQVRGGVRASGTLFRYALFVGNGPELDPGLTGHQEGGLGWENRSDVDQNKMIGGRFSVQPWSTIEIGVSGMTSENSAEGTSENELGATLFGADFAGRFDAGNAGMVRIDAEYVNSEVDDATYLPGTPDAFTFDNERNGGYVQAALRGRQSEAGDLLSKLEGVVRFDWVDHPEGTLHWEDEDRITLGVNYWFGPRTVLKIAVDEEDVDGVEENTIYLQLAIGV